MNWSTVGKVTWGHNNDHAAIEMHITIVEIMVEQNLWEERRREDKLSHAPGVEEEETSVASKLHFIFLTPIVVWIHELYEIKEGWNGCV